MRPEYLTADEEAQRAFSLGFWRVEIEVGTNGASAFVWRKYQRGEGRSMHGATIAEAIHKAVDRVLDREQSTGVGPHRASQTPAGGP